MALRMEALAAVLLFAFPLFAIPVKSWASSIYYLLALIALFALKRPRPPLSRVETIFVGLILFYLAVTIVANTLSGWTRSSVGWYEADLRIMLAIPIYLYLRIRTHLVTWLLRAIPIAALISGAYVLWMTIMFDGRVEGPYGPIFAGDICALFAVLSLATMSFRLYPRSFGIALHAGAFAAGLSGALLSGTRGAWLALILILPLFCWSGLRALRPERRRSVILGGSVAGLAVISAVALVQPHLVNDRVMEAMQQGKHFLSARESPDLAARNLGSIGTRLEQWRAGLLIAGEYPLFGIGVGNVLPELQARVESGEVHPSVLIPNAGTRRGVHLHSGYVDALVFKGVVGLLALLCVLGFPLWLAMNRENRGSSASTLLVVHTFMVAAFALTEDPFIRNNFTSIYLTILVCSVALLARHAEGQRRETIPR
ncbi:MAG: O-antigen ligase family protein [Gammaproteobacteria bacterium]|nr:O-antigen ligase family protein [Gammaproteobacteria bacterium]